MKPSKFKPGLIAMMLSTLFLLSIFSGNAGAKVTTIWVSSSDAALKSDQKASSATVATLLFGAELKVLSYENKWYQVEVAGSGKKGWIYRGKVAAEKPVASETGTEGLLGDLAAVSIRADAADSSRSIRGLSPEAKEYAKNNGTPEVLQQEVDQVMSRKLSVDDIMEFLKTGGIGEYAE